MKLATGGREISQYYPGNERHAVQTGFGTVSYTHLDVYKRQALHANAEK